MTEENNERSRVRMCVYVSGHVCTQGVKQEILHFRGTALSFSFHIFRDVLVSPWLPSTRPCWWRVSSPLQTVGSYLNEFILSDKAKGIQMLTLISTDTPRTCYASYHIKGNQGQDVLWVHGPGAVISDPWSWGCHK